MTDSHKVSDISSTYRKFNPGIAQTDQDIIGQFVIREQQLQMVMELVKENLSASSNQHTLIVAPRGRGKTMLMMRIAAEIRQQEELSSQLMAINFTEESHEILNMAEFWLECLFHLARTVKTFDENHSTSLFETHTELATCLDDQSLEQRARAAVLDVADKYQRKLVLLVENLQDLTEDADDDFSWQLRKILQTENRIMLIASATCKFSALEKVDKAFFELFREISLPRLNTEECERLWLAATGEQKSRNIRPLEIITGGSPRLMIIFAGLSQHRSMHQLLNELVELIDDHTEYFRSHLDAFAPRERKVYLALIDLWQASTSNEVAQRARMDIRATSSLLGRLEKKGAIISNQGKGKKKLYSVSERLYCIYYKLRRERNEASLVHSFITFMSSFYSDSELDSLMQNLLAETQEQSSLKSGLRAAIMQDENVREQILGVIDFSKFRELFDGNNEDVWFNNQIEQANKAVNNSDYEAANKVLEALLQNFSENEKFNKEIMLVLTMQSATLNALNRFEDAIKVCEKITQLYLDEGSDNGLIRDYYTIGLSTYGDTLKSLGRTNEALEIYQQLISQQSENKFEPIQIIVRHAFFKIATILISTDQYEKLIDNCQQALTYIHALKGDSYGLDKATALFWRSSALLLLKRTGDAFKSFGELVECFFLDESEAIQSLVNDAILYQGMLLMVQNQTKTALLSFGKLLGRPSFDIEKLIGLGKYIATNKSLISPIIKTISDNNKEVELQPFLIALKLENGETVRAPEEMLEVAADIRDQIAELRNS